MKNIQNEVINIHHKYGTSEMANYNIQLLFEKYAKEYHDSDVKKITRLFYNSQLPYTKEEWEESKRIKSSHIKFMNELYGNNEHENILSLSDVVGNSFEWDKFANALKDEFGESLVKEEDGEDDSYNWWLTDVTVTDIVDFIKKYH